MQVGVLGFGNVAAATVEKFIANRDLIAAKTGADIRLARVATRSVNRAVGRVPQGCKISSDCWSVVDDPEIDVVIELIGGVDSARELVLRAIANGKHVITANKALLARYGEEIMQLAEQKGVCVLFEGAVAVSIPIIKTLKESAAANRVSSVVGILNGTSNYILSQMSEHGIDFDAALADAQRKGYAEADPAMDVNGDDAAHKITLLASLAFGVPIDFSTVQFDGITGIERVDIHLSKQMGYALRLIAQAQLKGDRLYMSVSPTLVPDDSMLAHVRGSMNGITLVADLFGRAFFYGSGAGGVETASAVLADLIDLAQRGSDGRYAGAPNMGFKRSAVTRKDCLHADEWRSRFYLRLRVADADGVLAKVSAIFANADISTSKLLQSASEGGMTDLVAITQTISTRSLRSILPELHQVAASDHALVAYPVLDACV